MMLHDPNDHSPRSRFGAAIIQALALGSACAFVVLLFIVMFYFFG